jgi:hypothetical protein
MLTQCIAYAKLVYNKKLNAYKMQIAFNVHKELVGTNYKMRFPVQSKCNYVSGDLLAENLERKYNALLQQQASTCVQHKL